MRAEEPRGHVDGIADYLNVLSRQLPAAVVEELADGLEETYRRHLGLGLGPEAAARATVAEFGDPQAIAAEFAASTRPATPPAGCSRSGRSWGPAGPWP